MDILSRAVGPERARVAFDALSLPPSVSIRYNPFKFRSDEPGNRVPWCEYGMMLPERPKFVMDPLSKTVRRWSSDIFSENILTVSKALGGRSGC